MRWSKGPILLLLLTPNPGGGVMGFCLGSNFLVDLGEGLWLGKP